MTDGLGFKRMAAAATFFLLQTATSFSGLVEVARRGSASQTTEWNGGLFPAIGAIDGNGATFSHTDSSTPNNGWQVLFDREYEVARIEVQMRGDCCGGRMTGAIVRGWDRNGDSVYEVELTDPGAGATVSFDLPAGVMMSRLRIGFENGRGNPGTGLPVVHLAEVRVMAQDEPPVSIDSFSATPKEVAPGEVVTVSWVSRNAENLRLFPGGRELPAVGSLTIRPEESAIFEIVGENDRGMVRQLIGVVVDGESLPLQISEIMAANDGSLVRSDGSTPDWIELWNPNPFPVDVTGYGLSDDGGELRKFVFSEGVIEAGEYLVVDAADTSVDGVRATGFRLGREEGNRLILSSPEGTVLEDLVYPRQVGDVGYGRLREGEFRYWAEPTPGGVNVGKMVEGYVEDTRFSVRRGFYQEPQFVEIDCATPGASIYLTTDGTEPAPNNPSAQIYQGAVRIAGTTVLRAAAFREGWEPTNVDTQTYLFVDQVRGQSSTPDGFPQQWVPSLSGVQRAVPAFSHFGMNAQVLSRLPEVDSGGESFDLEAALTSIPTMSLVLDAEELFDPVEGLHVNARQRGRSWERKVSFEVIDPRDGTSVQADCGLRMHGGWNRFPEKLKKSFRLYFRSENGDGKLDYPMFPGSDIEEFDRLILRSGNGKAWSSPWRALSGGGNSLERVTYLRDQLVRDLQGRMGNASIPGSFMHLYINGHYWGLYNPVERPTEHFAAARFGGDDEEYDVIKWIRGVGHDVSAGDDQAWNQLISLVRSNVLNPATYEAIQGLLDLENFADYMIVNHYAGNIDWIDNNVYAMRRKSPGGPFRFYCWDSEESFLSIGADVSDRLVNDTCTEIHMALRAHPEYRLLFGDRVHLHLFNGGALTPELAGEVLDFRSSFIDRAIVGESARWGDLLRPAAPYDRADWLAEVANLKNNYLSRRGEVALNQWIADRLYPNVEAPVFQPQHGGQLGQGTPVRLEGESEGTIYYTLDGSDPRLPGGGVSAAAIEFDGGMEEEELVGPGSVWRYRDDGSDLGASDLVRGSPGYDEANWKHENFPDAGWASGAAPLGYGAISGVALNTIVSFGDDLAMKHRTTYFRRTFEAENVGRFVSLNLQVMSDDGAVVYLNGREVGRDGFPEDVGVVTAETLAIGRSGLSESERRFFEVPSAFLNEGANVLTVEVHQASDGSSDLGFDLELKGVTVSEGGRIDLEGGTEIKARVLERGEWSALTEALFLPGDRARDLVLSELMYHPAEGGAEFLEIVNRGRVRHPLFDLQIVGGIQFDFGEASVSFLDPGDRVILVRNEARFLLAYPGVAFGGEYSGGLGNGGDAFALVDREGSVLWEMEYLDDAPWPSGTDGDGRSFVYLGGRPSHSGSWRPSVELGGNPGTTDLRRLGQGENLTGYAIAGLDVVIGEAGETMVVLDLQPGADEVEVIPEWSGDLITWSTEGLSLQSQTPVASGGVLKVWRLPEATGGRRFFLRGRAIRR